MTSALPATVSRAVARGALTALAGALTLGCLTAPAASATAPSGHRGATSAGGLAARDGLPPGRRIDRHTVRAGDTATELAVRYHAWTAELIELNGLGPSATLRVGQRLRIPVVVAAERRDRDHRDSRPAKKQARSAKKPSPKNWQHADPSRERVRRTIARTAMRLGVDPQLALAVSWQESGWQMDQVSSADAIGAMQVLPDTGTWMSLYAGRRLHLRSLGDNALAGVLLLELLDDQTLSTRQQLAAYYQGLGAVREHGIYPVSRPYVANVLAIKRRLEAGRQPS